MRDDKLRTEVERMKQVRIATREAPSNCEEESDLSNALERQNCQMEDSVINWSFSIRRFLASLSYNELIGVRLLEDGQHFFGQPKCHGRWARGPCSDVDAMQCNVHCSPKKRSRIAKLHCTKRRN